MATEASLRDAENTPDSQAIALARATSQVTGPQYAQNIRKSICLYTCTRGSATDVRIT